VGATDNERLRQELARVGGIEGVHTEGRNIILARYAALLQRIHDAAGEKAVAVFLQSKKG
jgi:hypothetical protein